MNAQAAPALQCLEGVSASAEGEPVFHLTQRVFKHDRFPNVVVTLEGTVLLVWGSRSVHARRSVDAGLTWGERITIAGAGIHSGGVTVDEVSGQILVFVEDEHPPALLKVYCSGDDGQSWIVDDTVVVLADAAGRVPSMHMNEHGITLQNGAHAGRLLRCSRWYGPAGDTDAAFQDHFTNAVYSDDRGKTWQASEPFPAMGTGEAAVAELNTGTVYYNSRRHWAPEGVANKRRWSAHSSNGGKTWEGLTVVDDLPDGPQGGYDDGFGLFGGLVRLPASDRNVLIYSNCDSDEFRQNGAVWASLDAGRTWPLKRQIYEGSFAYSSLAAGRIDTVSQGWVFCFFENTDFGPGDGYVARFNLLWLLESPAESDGTRNRSETDPG